MSSAKLFLIISSSAFLLSCGAIGIRLTLLSRRTGGMPERMLGIGLATMTCVAVPLNAISGLGRLNAGELDYRALVLGNIALWIGFTGVAGFTWKAFRPADEWAAMLMLALSSAMAAVCGGTVAAQLSSPPELSAFEAGFLWSGLLRIPLVVAFAWTAIESLRNYGMARKRIAIGLGDPVVANRFLLWGIVGVVQVCVHTVSLTLHFQGMGMMQSAIGLFVVSAGGLAGAALLYLTFMTPQAYERFLRSRAVAGSA